MAKKGILIPIVNLKLQNYLFTFSSADISIHVQYIYVTDSESRGSRGSGFLIEVRLVDEVVTKRSGSWLGDGGGMHQMWK